MESTQCLSFWLCTTQLRGKGTARNVEYNRDGETLIGKKVGQHRAASAVQGVNEITLEKVGK